MTTNFNLMFVLVFVANLVITVQSSDCVQSRLKSSTRDKLGTDENEADEIEQANRKVAWQKLIRRYLIVYLLATLSDWLQGAYVYALYLDYHYTQHDIAILFVAGFGSSMIFGSFLGGLADRFGRKRSVMLYVVVYALSCITKHFKDFGVLLFGRLLAGIATSLLFSIFDSWLIRAHADHNVKQFLAKSFSWATYGNSVAAVIAGLASHHAAASLNMKAIVPEYFYVGGSLAPFDLAFGTLILCGICCVFLWEENYGEMNRDGSRKGNEGVWYDGLKEAFKTMVQNKDILICGFICSLFEGSMYIWIFMWTPGLKEMTDEHLPFGLIFAIFMVCSMAGSSIFSMLIEKYKAEVLAVGLFILSAVSMVLMAVFRTDMTAKLMAMNLFELCVGMYWPLMGMIKSAIVPESKRSAIYNLHRIPLNFIVLFSLLTDLTPTQSFWFNTFMLIVATGLQYWLMQSRATHMSKEDMPDENTRHVKTLPAETESLLEMEVDPDLPEEETGAAV